MDLVFVHGWGSGPFVWKFVTPHFDNHQCHIVNMGFLGDKDFTMPTEEFIGIGHSLGGLWLLKHYPEQMKGFISIASFNCFYKYVPQQILSKMKRNIANNVTAQVKDFWHHAGLDQPEGFKNLKPLILAEGLTWLSKWKADIPGTMPIKVLACRDDYIVPEQMTANIWCNHHIDWIDKGGHMLPITQPEWCIGHIKDFLTHVE